MEHYSIKDLSGEHFCERLLREHFSDLDSEGLVARFLARIKPEVMACRIAKSNPVVRLAVFNGGRIVGLLDAYKLGNLDIEIGISVTKDMQGRGIGRTLLAQALSDARLSGSRKVILLMSCDNMKMRGLAQRLGAAFQRLDGMLAAMFAPGCSTAAT